MSEVLQCIPMVYPRSPHEIFLLALDIMQYQNISFTYVSEISLRFVWIHGSCLNCFFSREYSIYNFSFSEIQTDQRAEIFIMHMDEWNRFSPVALTRKNPVTEFVVHYFFSESFIFGYSCEFFSCLCRTQSIKIS